MIKKVLRNRQAVIGLVIIGGIVLAALFAPAIAPHDPAQINMDFKFADSSSVYPLGTDQLGRCLFSRILFGARYSLGLAVPIIVLLSIIGTVIGVLGGYFGGIVERLFEILCNIFMAFPPLVIVLAVAGIRGTGVVNLVMAIVFSMWVWFVKVVRSCVLMEKNKDYIIAARIAGANDIQIILNHIFPNIFPTLLIYFSTSIASVILMISGYSFLGLGFETGTPEWGAMISEAKSYIYSQPSLILWPGGCILLTATGFNLFGEALRDILNEER